MQDTAYVPKPKTGYSPNACPIPLPQFGCNSFHSPTAATARSRSSGSGIPVASRSLLLNEFQDLHLLQKLRQAPRTGSPPHGEQKVTVPEAPGHGLRTCGRKHPVDERSPEVKAASYIFRSRASCMRRSHAEQIGVCLQRSDGHPSKFMKFFLGGGKIWNFRGIYTIFAADWFPSDFFRVGGLKGNRVKFPDRPAAVKLRQSSGQSVPLAVSCWEGVRMRSQSEDLPTIYGFNRTRGPVGWIAL